MDYNIFTVKKSKICIVITLIRYNAKIIIFLNKIFVNIIHIYVKEWYNNVKLNNKR